MVKMTPPLKLILSNQAYPPTENSVWKYSPIQISDSTATFIKKKKIYTKLIRPGRVNVAKAGGATGSSKIVLNHLLFYNSPMASATKEFCTLRNDRHLLVTV